MSNLVFAGHVADQADQSHCGVHGARGPRAGRAGVTSFPGECSDEDWERIGRYCVQRRFDAGEEIVRQGEIDRSLGIIMSGSADLVVVDGRGAEHRLAVMDAPSVVGEVSFLDAGPRSAFALIALLFVRPRDGLIAWWLFILPCIPRY